jgi:menaquinone-9 beta-reductase
MSNTYNCAIIGGGVAGLSLANSLAKAGLSVILFEKNTYPFHKVCGEYISMESWDYLSSLGLDLEHMDLPKINKLGVSAVDGFMLSSPLELGGFGISRYLLDSSLAVLAANKGVVVVEECKVMNVIQQGQCNKILTIKGEYTADLVCGSYGKYKPAFIASNQKSNNEYQNYIGVKYHIKTDFDHTKIELHNFKDGYCGISKVEDDVCCLCYLTTSDNLKNNNNSIAQMEENVLHKNPYLKHYFTTSEMLYPEALVISNIHFKKRSTSADGIMQLGDAAGSITPLCGNGMSMALRTSHLLSQLVKAHFDKSIDKDTLMASYDKIWNDNFSTRITAGYYLQGLFGKDRMTGVALRVLNRMPWVMGRVIEATHGKKF